MNYIESNCTVEFQGKSFESGGAVVTPDYLLAYPGDNGMLNDWHGKPIGTFKVISSRPAIFFGRKSFISDRYYYMAAKVDGVCYSLRGFGTGMIAKGKKIKCN